MKKYFALLLALGMMFLCAACGGTAGGDSTADESHKGTTAEDHAVEDVAEPVALGVKSLEFAVAEADAEPEGFLCVVDRGDKYCWQIGVDSYEELYEIFDLTSDPSTYVNIYVAAENEEKYPYLYPEEGWKAYVTADSINAWFNDEYKDGVVAAFNEWLEEVYSKFDYEKIRTATIDEYVAASPADDYVVTEDDIALFHEYTENRMGLNDIRPILYAELGESVGDDAYQYLLNKVAYKVKNKADVGTLLKKMGITNNGGTQEGFCITIIGTYFDFDCDEWKTLEGGLDVISRFLERGMTFSSASDNMNRLHCIDGGRILYEESVNETSGNNAFAVVAGKDGALYWRVGIDNCETIRTVFGLSGTEDYLDLQVYPVIDQSKAEYSLPDGLNPEVTRYFIYFEDDAVVWTLQTRGGVEYPDWFTSDMESAVMAAFEEWKTQAYSHFDLNAALAMYPEESVQADTYTDEDIALLKEYVTVVRDIEEQGLTVTGVLSESITSACGSTLYNEMIDWNRAKWRLVHTDCPLPCLKIGYCEYYGLTFVDDSDYTMVNDDVVTTMVSTAFTNIDWIYTTENGGNPFQAGIDLLNKGLVVYPGSDSNWYICSGKGTTVLGVISEAELLAN